MKMNPLPSEFYPLLRAMIRFPEQEINALDIASRAFKVGRGEPLLHLTADEKNIKRYLVGSSVTSKSNYERVVEDHVILSTQAKITMASFPFVMAAPPVNDYIHEEYRLQDTHIRLPDFVSRARRNLILKKASQVDSEGETGIDFEIQETPEEIAERQAREQEELEKEILSLRKAEYRRINEHDFETSSQRNEIAYLQQCYKNLAPGGILVFLTHRQLMDKPFLQYMNSSFEEVEFMNIPEDENNRILITGRRRVKKAKLDTSQVNNWIRYRYGTEEESMPDVGLVDRKYQVPYIDVEALQQFRIGPITMDEVGLLTSRSTLVDRVSDTEMRLPVYEPSAPAPLHKGHLVQLLTSGMMDSYIGTGEEQHLVKGSSVCLTNVTAEENDDGEEVTTSRDYYTVNLKLLLPDGTFRQVR